MSASYYSQRMAILLIEETLWAKKQLETNFDSSDEAELVNITLSATYLYRFIKFVISASLLNDPKTTLSGLIMSAMAVPSAKNYGLLVIT